MITPSFSLTATERVLPKLALDFTTGSLDPRVTFTRTTNATAPATYVNSAGHVTSSADNQPRFDYSPTTLSCKGLLIEESRTNAMRQSQTFDVTWTPVSATFAAGATTSPDGTVNGYKLEEDATNAAHYFQQSCSTVSGSTYTASIYIKAAERSVIYFRFATVNKYGYFDVSTQTVSGLSSGTTGIIEDAGQGWYRCILTFTTTYTGSAEAFRVYASPAAGTAGYQGVLGYGLYAWGAQLEAGAFATSYIPTTTTALTRNADVATMTGTNFSSWFNASQGSFEFVGDLPALFNGPTFIKADNGTETERYFLYGNSSFSPTIVVTDGGASQTTRSSGTLVANTQFKTVYGYKLDDFGISTNAGSVQTDTTGTLPTVTQLGIGCNAAGTPAAFMNGHVAKVFYWPQKLTSAEIRAFSK